MATASGARPVFSRLRIVGQVFDGYLVCEGPDAFVLIDQHAAHERVVFERLRSSYARGPLPEQLLLTGTVVPLSPHAAASIIDHRDEVRRLGFDLEPFGPEAVVVRTVPALLAHLNPVELVRDLAEEIVDVDRAQGFDRVVDSVFARMACHTAVRVGQSLSPEEIRGLLEAMDEIDFSAHCPHGRPTFLLWPRGEIERLFRRV
jgi:DNA mismatch repair protein MutL